MQIGALNSAVYGFQTNTQSVNRAAHRIANVNNDEVESDLPKDMVDMMVGQRGFDANTATVHTADEMLQELLLLKRPT